MVIWEIAVWLVLFALLLGLYFTVTSATREADGEDSVPKLICKPSALSSYLTRNCKSFWLCPRAGWPHFQTLYSGLWPGPGSLHLVREHLQMSDGGVIGLDWAVSGEEELGEGNRRYRDTPPPILLLIPNNLGAVSGHCRRLLQLALRRGYRPLLFNRRLHNSVPLTSRRLLPFGDPSDLREAVSYIRYKHPLAPLFAASESSGSALLLSYLGECGSSSYMTAAACISPILRCQHWLEDGPHGLYRWFMLCYQKTSLSRYATVLGEIIDTEKLFRSCTLRELEETLFCQSKVNNLSWASYWEKNDPLRDVDEVAVPLLCICSKDDPCRGNPEVTLPFELFETNPYFFLLLTNHGGHCGFLTSSCSSWSHEAVLEYFKSVSDFFRAEERTKSIYRRKRSITSHKRRGPATHKESVCFQNIHEIFNWQRSYTR
ncbi:protein ABHD15-like isoform X2 [Stegostoma tigrinum]|uniref:protein ABHD15-like isoform X2 n=1 Tax=Stegostoma tigrinum TaxID=3053191 RepID=UPI00202B85A2|nr:protein ABHD15-like isoform X2 [Stegostoma tigrinum]